MKKIMTKSLCLLLFLFLNHSIGLAQPKKSAPPDPEGMVVNRNFCVQHIDLEVPIPNLDQFAPDGVGDIEFFPPSRPPMFLVSTISGDISIIQLDTFKYKETVAGNVNVYLATVARPIDLCNICDNYPGNNDHTLYMKLMTWDGVDYVDYPACSYIDPLDIFSCLATPQDCAASTCNNLPLIAGEEIIPITCRPGGGSGGSGSGNDGNGPSSSNVRDIDITLFENPVYQSVEISTTDVLDNVSILIFDSSGKRIKNETRDQMTGSIRIDLADNPHGIYYISVYSDQGRIVKKFIKI